MFRDLRAEEIECRVQSISDKVCTLLLYKDARVDANILDETVGAKNWQRHHTRDNANCIVSIWDEEKKQWIEKEDTGSESNTQKEKGLASDSFKRACFQWGIGRELYTSPEIKLFASNNLYNVVQDKNGKVTTYDKFNVKLIKVKDGVISDLQIVNEKMGNKVVFSMNGEIEKAKNDASKNPTKNLIREEQKEILRKILAEKGHTESAIQGGIDNLTQERYGEIIDKLNG